MLTISLGYVRNSRTLRLHVHGHATRRRGTDALPEDDTNGKLLCAAVSTLGLSLVEWVDQDPPSAPHQAIFTSGITYVVRPETPAEVFHLVRCGLERLAKSAADFMTLRVKEAP